MGYNDMEIFDINKMEEKANALQTKIDEFGTLFDNMRENFVSHINESENSALYGEYGARLIATYDANIPDLSTFKNNFEMWVQFITFAINQDLKLLDEVESTYKSSKQSNASTTSASSTVYGGTKIEGAIENTIKTQEKSMGGSNTIAPASNRMSDGSIQNKHNRAQERIIATDDKQSAEEKTIISSGDEKIVNQEVIIRKTRDEIPEGRMSGGHAIRDNNNEISIVRRQTLDHNTLTNTDATTIEQDLNTSEVTQNQGMLQSDVKNLQTSFIQQRESDFKSVAEKIQAGQINGTALFNPEEFSKQHLEELNDRLQSNSFKPLEPIQGPIPFQPKQTPVMDISSSANK